MYVKNSDKRAHYPLSTEAKIVPEQGCMDSLYAETRERGPDERLSLSWKKEGVRKRLIASCPYYIHSCHACARCKD